MLKPGKSSYPLPPENKPLSACHALQSVRIVPRPRPMCPAGLHVPEILVFCRKVLVRREKLATVRKFDKHTYTYYHPTRTAVLNSARNTGLIYCGKNKGCGSIKSTAPVTYDNKKLEIWSRLDFLFDIGTFYTNFSIVTPANIIFPCIRVILPFLLLNTPLFLCNAVSYCCFRFDF